MYVYVICIYVYVCVYVCIYVYVHRCRNVQWQGEGVGRTALLMTGEARVAAERGAKRVLEERERERERVYRQSRRDEGVSCCSLQVDRLCSLLLLCISYILVRIDRSKVWRFVHKWCLPVV